MKTQKQADILERKVIARSGVVLYTLVGSRGDTYLITAKDGVVDGRTHQDCPGFARCGYCYHVKDVNAIESELVAERKMAAYLNCYDAMAFVTTPAIAQVRKVDGLGYRHEWYPKTSL